MRPALTDADGGSIAVGRPNPADLAEDQLRTLILGRFSFWEAASTSLPDWRRSL